MEFGNCAPIAGAKYDKIKFQQTLRREDETPSFS